MSSNWATMYSDHELIAKITAGNLHAFRLLVRANERLVQHMVQRFVKDNEQAKDVCQEVFIKVYKNIAHFKQESKLSTWIAQIAYTTSLDYLKGIQRKHRTVVNMDDHHHHIEGGLNPEQEFNKKELRTFIAQLIDQLPDNYRLVVNLFHIDEYSYQEIVAITGLSEGTIKSHLFRARKLLKDKLANLVN